MINIDKYVTYLACSVNTEIYSKTRVLQHVVILWFVFGVFCVSWILSNPGSVCKMDVAEDMGLWQAVVNTVKNLNLHKIVNLQVTVLFHMVCVCGCHISAVQARGEQPRF